MYVYVHPTLWSDSGSLSLLPWWQLQLAPFIFQMGLSPTVRISFSTFSMTSNIQSCCNTKGVTEWAVCLWLQRGLWWALGGLFASSWSSWCCWWTSPTHGTSHGWRRWRPAVPGAGTQVSDSTVCTKWYTAYYLQVCLSVCFVNTLEFNNKIHL